MSPRSGRSERTAAAQADAPGSYGWCNGEPSETRASASHPASGCLAGLGSGSGMRARSRCRDCETDRSDPISSAQVRSQLAGPHDPRYDKILTRACRLRLIVVRLQDPEAVSVSPRQLTQHERSNRSDLPPDARNRPLQLNLVGMEGKHPHPGVQQRVDQQPVGAFDRDQLNLETLKRPQQRADPVLVMRERRPTVPSPAGSSISTSCFSDAQSIRAQLHHPSASEIRPCRDKEVPLRVLIDKALTRGYVLSPLAAPHHRRERAGVRWAFTQGQAAVALSRRRSRPPQNVYET
jgi:hypothetical protein